MSNINTELFNDTAVVKSPKSKQVIDNEPKKRGRKSFITLMKNVSMLEENNKSNTVNVKSKS